MTNDPRTAGGAAPMQTVTLTRAPLNVPLLPQAPGTQDQGHMALGSGTEIAADSSRGFSPQEVSAVAPAPDLIRDGHGFLGLLKAANVPGDQVRAATRFAQQATPTYTQQQLDALDDRDVQAGVTELRQIWGPRFEENADALEDYLGALPEAERNAILNARHADTGRRLSNDPANIVRLVGLARQPRPQVATIEGIEAFMKANRTAYNKDEALQARYLELLNERARKGGG